MLLVLIYLSKFYVARRWMSRCPGLMDLNKQLYLRNSQPIIFRIIFNNNVKTGSHEEYGIHVNNHFHCTTVENGGVFKKQLADKLM